MHKKKRQLCSKARQIGNETYFSHQAFSQSMESSRKHSRLCVKPFRFRFVAPMIQKSQSIQATMQAVAPFPGGHAVRPFNYSWLRLMRERLQGHVVGHAQPGNPQQDSTQNNDGTLKLCLAVWDSTLLAILVSR